MPGTELRRLLMIDDDIDIQLIARVTLEEMSGFELRVCSDGAEAMLQLAEFTPDLILLDAMLPGLSGSEIFTVLAANPNTSSIPVVFVTAKSEPDELTALRELGALDVIVKPFDPMTLPDTLRALWQRHLSG